MVYWKKLIRQHHAAKHKILHDVICVLRLTKCHICFGRIENLLKTDQTSFQYHRLWYIKIKYKAQEALLQNVIFFEHWRPISPSILRNKRNSEGAWEHSISRCEIGEQDVVTRCYRRLHGMSNISFPEYFAKCAYDFDDFIRLWIWQQYNSFV